MFARAVLAFLALPGVVAFGIPIVWALTSERDQPLQHLGWIPFVAGCAGILWCAADFYTAGKGTLAPWSPPSELVTVGLYRYTRNPMYVAVTLILIGWAILFRSTGLFVYAFCVVLAFHLRVVLGEEPWLERTHGSKWSEYIRRVPRWFW